MDIELITFLESVYLLYMYFIYKTNYSYMNYQTLYKMSANKIIFNIVNFLHFGVHLKVITIY